MESKQQSAPIKTPRSRVSLAGSLVRTLLVFTFIPLMLMAGAAYLRSRALLRGHVVNQMQTQLTSQIDQANVIVKTKEIRLDRVVRTQNFANDIDTALHVAPQSEEFKMAREELAREANKATFSQYFLMKPDSTILIASNPGWEGVSLGNASYYQALNESDRQSFTLYDIPSLYPGQLVLVTVAQYPAAGGSRLGTFVGITESQSLQEILQSLTSINPSANAYFVTQSGVYIGTDPYTSQLTAFQPSDSQNAGLGRVLDEMMSDALGAPRSLEFNARDGQPVLAQAKWLTFMKTGVVLEIPQSQVFGQLNTLIPFTIAIFLISLLAMAGVIWLGTNRVFRPGHPARRGPGPASARCGPGDCRSHHRSPGTWDSFAGRTRSGRRGRGRRTPPPSSLVGERYHQDPRRIERVTEPAHQLPHALAVGPEMSQLLADGPGRAFQGHGHFPLGGRIPQA